MFVHQESVTNSFVNRPEQATGFRDFLGGRTGHDEQAVSISTSNGWQ